MGGAPVAEGVLVLNAEPTTSASGSSDNPAQITAAVSGWKIVVCPRRTNRAAAAPTTACARLAIGRSLAIPGRDSAGRQELRGRFGAQDGVSPLAATGCRSRGA